MGHRGHHQGPPSDPRLYRVHQAGSHEELQEGYDIRITKKMEAGKKYVLRRKDGKYFSVWGWSIEWSDKPDHSCPIFTTDNIRDPYFHGAWIKRFSGCELEEVK